MKITLFRIQRSCYPELVSGFSKLTHKKAEQKKPIKITRNNMAIVKTSRKLHKWLMLIVGIQMLVWAVTGTYMVVMNIDFIHGDSLVVIDNKKINNNQVQFSLAALQQKFPKAERISLTTRLSQTLRSQVVYQFKNGDNWQLASAQDGELLSNFNKKQAQAIALNRYTGKGDIIATELLTEPNGEVSPRILPAWEVSFNDFAAPRLYISSKTGELVAKRHDYWVLFDWLFRFHIMDYGEEENAGNRLLLTIALISLLASITGVVLTYVSFVKVRGKSIKFPRNKSTHRFMPWVLFLHRWLSLLVFIQLMLWLSTGLYFNLMDHNKASGNQYRQRMSQTTNQFDFAKLKPLTQVLTQYPKAIQVELIVRLNKPYYLLTMSHGLYVHFPRIQQLVSADSGQLIELNNYIIENLAHRSYSGQGKVQLSSKLSPPIAELPKQQNPLWKVNFNDELSTSVYIDSQNGNIIAHVDDDKRLANFMFKLHFMNYELFGAKLGSFNNTMIIFFALLTLLFSLTGVYWLVHMVKHKQFRW